MSEPLGKNPIDLFEERVILFQPAFHVSGMGMSLLFVWWSQAGHRATPARDQNGFPPERHSPQEFRKVPLRLRYVHGFLFDSTQLSSLYDHYDYLGYLDQVFADHPEPAAATSNVPVATVNSAVSASGKGSRVPRFQGIPRSQSGRGLRVGGASGRDRRAVTFTIAGRRAKAPPTFRFHKLSTFNFQLSTTSQKSRWL